MSRYIPQNVRTNIYLRQNKKCGNCQNYIELFDVDHIIPFSICRNNNPRNLQALCLNCHRLKSASEKKDILIFLKLKETRNPQCWKCKKLVSPYFMDGILCNECDQNDITRIMEKMYIKNG